MDDEAEKALAEFLTRWPVRGMIRKEIWATDMKQEYRSAFLAGWQAAMHSGIKFDGAGDFVKAPDTPSVTVSVVAGGNTYVSGTTVERK